ncbi:hypothetical protein JD292_06215 [Leucobacter sp. CSA2]|uniref:Fibronectin type-III domain-containing protein n=1 Tax=Leucobacter edaphi TaxID=2796472 RepID=A0A934QBJ8_9MICO|nr:Ig-like domain-containing protein [Leucobacter edaphi]MBK0421665.1 hypothetical protein [Leucobacter edaphi]
MPPSPGPGAAAPRGAAWKAKQRKPRGQGRPAPRTRAEAERTRNIRLWMAGAVAFALVATIAVVANGYDARETPRVEPGVWVARDAGQYARVNTDTGELDLVRKVSEPSGVMQAGDSTLVLSHGNGRAWPVDDANPVDLNDHDRSGADNAQTASNPGGAAQQQGAGGPGSGAGTESDANAEDNAAVSMPEGTRDVTSVGRYVAVRTESGAVYAGSLTRDAENELPARATPAEIARNLQSLSPIDPIAAANAEKKPEKGAEEGTDYKADAVSVSADGVVAMYSATEKAVHRFDLAKGEFINGGEAVSGRAADPQLTLVGNEWALLDTRDGRLWRQGADESKLTAGASVRLQAPSSKPGADVLVADENGLWSVPKGGTPKRIAEANGIPAKPAEVKGTLYAAWLGPSSGSLWTGEGEPVRLSFDESVQTGGDWEPFIRSNGERGVLSEERSGMLWTLPEGKMIPVSQWSISDPPKENRGKVVVDEVTEQLPPTAVPDDFGVRAGTPTPLPVLLNDFDPNTNDVLTIVPESLGNGGLPKSFGTLQISPDGQTLMLSPAADARGTASFSYRITDGSLQSQPAKVTLRVVPEEKNTAPQWCPVEGCQRTWGVPAIVPGGTLVAPILEGWVDPDGDVMTLVSARPLRADDPVRAIVTADGRLALRHLDPNAGASDVMLDIVVSDSRGAEQHRELQVKVQPDAVAKFTNSAATVSTGRALVVNPLERVAGGSGSFALLDAAVQSGAATVKTNTSNGTITLTAKDAGVSTVSVSVKDTVTGGEITGSIKVTAISTPSSLVLPPLRAFVRPLADSTVEVLNALPGASARALSVVGAEVTDGNLSADIIDYSMVRVAGATKTGAPGRIGSVNLTVSEDGRKGNGTLTVFQVPENSASGAIAVADHATVRAGQVVDIRVLDNDVAAPGERLMLRPEVVGSGAKGELAFASGSTLRYLAPQKAGTYRIQYTAYGASAPQQSDVGSVLVTVVPKGANRAPNPTPLTARVAPGGDTSLQVPLSGVDPDGDRVRLIGVSASDDPQVTANIASTGSAIEVAASETAKAGVRSLKYEVRDAGGGTAEGALRVIVTDGTDTGQPPIALTDSVRLVPGGSPAVVKPLDNDLDPSRGKLSIQSVVPNVPGGKGSPEYERLAKRIDASAMKEGRVLVSPASAPGIVSYKYKVRSDKSKSTAEGLIVVQTSARVGTQAPSVSDTVLNVRDRALLSSEGVDVLTGKVRWATGDPSKLKLSVWKGNRGEYRVEGNRILGTYNPEGDLVVFNVSGVDSSGEKVSSYGFLQIPPLDELRITLKPGIAPLKVDEDKSVEANIASLVDVGPEDSVELGSGPFSVSRANARCDAAGATTLRYAAGKDAPWVDTCQMEVRLNGQKAWTALAVPVAITPKDPVAELRPITRTVSPGTTETVNLTEMVEWPGGRQGDPSKLRFSVSGGGSQFQIAASGSTAQVSAAANATPGSQQVVSVNVSGAGTSSSTLTLRVGPAASELPRGGTVSLRCTVGSACSTKVIGVPGEFDPYAGKQGAGLHLVSVQAGSCAVGTFSAGGDTVSVGWQGGRVTGGTCTASFTVKDAQGRTGTGSIELDAQGRPDAPTSITQTAYSDSSATFAVTLGGQAHPAVSSVVLSGAGSTSCSASGPSSYQCVATGLRNGEKHQFSARAVNAVGESAPSNSVTAWAYKAPETPTVSAEPVKDRSNTDQGHGAIKVTVKGSSDTREFRISIGGTNHGTLAGPSGNREYSGIGAGATTVTAVPVTSFDVPSIGTGSSTGSEGSTSVTVIGAPRMSGASIVSTGDTSAKIDASASAHAGESITMSYAMKQGGGADCTRGGDSDPKFENLTWRKSYGGAACARSDYGVTMATTDTIRIGTVPGALTANYSINKTPAPGGSSANYKVAGGLTAVGKTGGTKLEWAVNGAKVGSNAPSVDDYDSINTYTVRQCVDPSDEGTCSPWATATSSGAPAPARVDVNGDACWDDKAPPANAIELFTVSNAAAPYARAAAVGPGANGKITIEVSWVEAFKDLQPATFSVCFKPKAADPPPPTP